MTYGGLHDHEAAGDCICFRAQLIEHFDGARGHIAVSGVVAKIIAMGVVVGVRAAEEDPVWALATVARDRVLLTEEEDAFLDEVAADLIEGFPVPGEPPA